MHLDEEQLGRVAHGEVSATEQSMVAIHLDECVACHASLDAVRHADTFVRDVLCVLDAPVPDTSIAMTVARARTRPSHWLTRAASVLLVLGVGGAAWAAPGSPVREWLHNWLNNRRSTAAPTPLRAT